MICQEMDEVITSYSTTSGLVPEAVEHIAACERCRRLVEVFDKHRPALPPPAGQMKRIEAAVLGNLTPVRPLAPARTFLLAFALIYLVVVAVGSLLLGADSWRALGISQKIVVFTPLAACAALLAFSLVRLMVPGSKYVISPTLLCIAALMLPVLVIAAIFPRQQLSGFVPTGLMCLRTGLACAVPTAVLLWLLLRRGAILSPGLTGATAGGLAGLVGLMALEVRCPNLDGYHILVWHWGVTMLATLGGLALGRLPSRRA